MFLFFLFISSKINIFTKKIFVMKHLIKTLLPLLLILISATMAISQNDDIKNNPLIQEWNTPYQTPPFDKIKPDHYLPAFKYAIDVAKKEIDDIINNQQPATFENTIEAMDYSGLLLNKVSNLFFNMTEVNSTDDMRKIQYEVSPLTTAFANDISLNAKLFQRVKDVYNQKDKLKLNTEQKALLEKTYKNFARNGANLNDTDKEKYRKLTQELSQLSIKFGDNVLKETNAFLLELTEQKEISGLPQWALDMGAATAKQKGKSGWVYDLSIPNYVTIMKYADNRSVREKMFMAYNTRCFKGNEQDNKDNVIQIANTRLELAKLLGYKSFADYVLEERMAENQTKVNDFLKNLSTHCLPYAITDVKQEDLFANGLGFENKLEKWDWSYYSNKLQSKLFDLSDEILKPYFKLENVRDGIFKVAEKLYKLKFVKNDKIPVYSTGVDVYEVFDKDNKFLAVLYMDYFPSATKRGGAWMTNFREQYKYNGKDIRPIVQLVFNFTKPTQDTPSLLTFDEVSTFLHEFGHGLHSMLSDVIYISLSGTNVYRDFVELPSQFMENYADKKQFLELCAFDYKTGKLIPDELVKKIHDFNNFQAGYLAIRQLTFATLDMAWHSVEAPVTIDVNTFETKAILPLKVLPDVGGTDISVVFSHIFSGGYAAGYYGYKWAEVLDADAFSVFEKNGMFDAKTAESFKDNILSKGGTEHPMKLYKMFRGQEPAIDALLKRSGLTEKK